MPENKHQIPYFHYKTSTQINIILGLNKFMPYIKQKKTKNLINSNKLHYSNEIDVFIFVYCRIRILLQTIGIKILQ